LVTCRPNPQTDWFQDEPAVVFEVLSKKTRRVDEVEKKEAYLSIPSLSVYVMVEQDAPVAIVYRRTETGFVREVNEGLDAVLPLGEIGTELPLAEVYDDVEFIPEIDGEDEEC
jgi:Uma2 family endonuclease